MNERKQLHRSWIEAGSKLNIEAGRRKLDRRKLDRSWIEAGYIQKNASMRREMHPCGERERDESMRRERERDESILGDCD